MGVWFYRVQEGFERLVGCGFLRVFWAGASVVGDARVVLGLWVVFRVISSVVQGKFHRLLFQNLPTGFRLLFQNLPTGFSFRICPLSEPFHPFSK